MTLSTALACDGCGQPASPEHFARRLQWLEWTTRYRPVHIQALLLGGIAPPTEASFLYAPEGRFEGEAGSLVSALQIAREGKSADAVLAEFQKRGLLLTHILECPIEPTNASRTRSLELLERQLPAAIARIRRSLRPKKVVLFSKEIAPIAGKLLAANLGCPVLPADRGVFLLDPSLGAGQRADFRKALEAATA